MKKLFFLHFFLALMCSGMDLPPRANLYNLSTDLIFLNQKTLLDRLPSDLKEILKKKLYYMAAVRLFPLILTSRINNVGAAGYFHYHQGIFAKATRYSTEEVEKIFISPESDRQEKMLKVKSVIYRDKSIQQRLILPDKLGGETITLHKEELIPVWTKFLCANFFEKSSRIISLIDTAREYSLQAINVDEGKNMWPVIYRIPLSREEVGLVTAAYYYPEKDRIFFATSNDQTKSVYFFCSDKKTIIREIMQSKWPESEYKTMLATKDNYLITTHADGTSRKWDLESDFSYCTLLSKSRFLGCLNIIRHHKEFTESMQVSDLSSDQEHVLVVQPECQQSVLSPGCQFIQYINTKTKKCQQFGYEDNQQLITAVRFTHDGEKAVVVRYFPDHNQNYFSGSRITFWDLECFHQLIHFDMDDFSCRSLSFLYADDYMITDQVFWDIRTIKKMFNNFKMAQLPTIIKIFTAAQKLTASEIQNNLSKLKILCPDS